MEKKVKNYYEILEVDKKASSEVIEKAWEQLKEKTGGSPYHCPIPSEITPDILEAEIT